ncbi:hypothetical protein SERLA73DRAFT_189174 [Serpula lacrymans var. lacrymans S7.3]|uniref:Uncharacterized protein n=1 Tax=Serpula lacrymans var. lacrymans (strain S7.3) TaxID=936435 RepID=F8QD09_SERL3|nr:hypothetical protein SERLA73DRAFT_189174 [Serpula lacrymans var. lacrymans S7.3]
MAPPAFGMRPATKKVETPKEEIEKEIDSTSLKSQGVDFSADQGPVVDADHLSREVPADVVRENSASHDNSISSSSLSVDQPSPSLQPARAMPVPTGPRRAAPPRKKAVKSPSPQEQAHTILDKEETSVSPAQISNVSEDPAHTPASIKDLLGGDVESEIGVVNKSVDDHYPLSDAALSVPPSVPAQQEEQKLVIPDEPLAHSEQTANQSHVTHDLDLAEEPTDVPEATYDTTAELVSEPVSAEAEEDEEDEVARRKRVADKLAQMGGFNLFTVSPPIPSLPKLMQTLKHMRTRKMSLSWRNHQRLLSHPGVRASKSKKLTPHPRDWRGVPAPRKELTRPRFLTRTLMLENLSSMK